MSEPKIELRPALPYLGIPGRTSDGVPAFVDKAFPELYGWLREHGVEPAGPPFIRFRELDQAGEPLIERARRALTDPERLAHEVDVLLCHGGRVSLS